MKRSVSTLLFACTCLFIFAQEQPPPPVFAGPEAPQWMQMMQADSPNVFDIQRLYTAYYRDQPVEKNRYTQFYKRWMHWARPFTQGDGSLRFPTAAELADREQQLQALRPKPKPDADNLAPWSFVGPKQTYDLDGTTVVTWQTNIYSLDIAPSNANVLYAGGESGGLWKTIDKGLNWTLLTTNILHGAFGAVKIHPTDPNTVYAATGGKIIKTIDGGANWSTVYTESNLWVNEFAISPADPTIVLAASDQGLLRSTNSGASWTKLFTQKTWTVKHKPDDPSILFVVRKNGSSSDFMKSLNAGASFTASATGWWTPGSGETVGGAIIAVCPSDPNRLYAYLCGNGTNLYGYVGVFKSTNAGASWTNTHPTAAVGNTPTAYSIPTHTNLMAHNGTTGFDQGFYDMAIIVNPNNATQLIAGGTSWFRSNDAGATWTALGSYVGGLSWSHPDIQCTVVQGNDLWIASDGGLNYSNNWAGTIQARMNGISGADMWGFDSGWNEDILVGGRYHNGNMAWHESFPEGKFYRLGGAEAASGYVNPGPERKVYHSDIGGDRIRGGFANGTLGFPVGLFPNESYAYYANSEMVWHPACWNIIFLGHEQKLWKSSDGGASFTALYTFPGTVDNTVFDIEIARSNPLVMYCSQWDGTDDKIWRSTDGGASWTACTALPLPNNNDRVKMAVSAENANVLWVAVTYGSNGKKVYKTNDGGTSWTNLTTALLNGLTVQNIMAQYGTNGGVYLGANGGVFYRNNTHSDWQPYAEGLPLSAETNRLKPFYKTGKIRNGCWGFGVWEAPLFESSAVVVQAMADKLESACSRDTFYFDDYSVVLHDGAAWSWSFTGAQTILGSDTRTPRVIFGSTGPKQAIMTLSTPLGVYRDTLNLIVGNACDRDSLPGQAIQLDGAGDYLVANQALNLNSNTVTLMAWVKPNGPQNDWAGLVFCRGGNTTAGMSLRATGNELRYHWNDGGYNFGSGLQLPDNQWSHVAMVVTPDNVRLYLNGVSALSNTPQPAEEFDAPLQIGYDNGSRYFKGLLEEVCVYDRALSQNEIREVMHLARTHTNTTGLKMYYQFNESGNLALDRQGVRHASLAGDAQRVPSTCPVGPGFSARLNVTAGGAYTFPQTGLTLTFSAAGTNPNGELCATRINWTPDKVPVAEALSPAYWVVRNYGFNNTFSQLNSLNFSQIGSVPPGTVANEYKLFKRASNAEGNTWGSAVDVADQIVQGANGSATFSSGNGVNSFSQFIVGKPALALPVELLDFQASVLDEHSVQLDWATGSEQNTVSFIVERSADGSHFTAIGDIPAKGPSVARLDYVFTDKNPLPDRSFYRLRIEDADGTAAYSEVRSVQLNGSAPQIQVMPNPVLSNGRCTVTTNRDGVFHFRLFDEKGRAVRVLRFEGKGELALDGLPAGVYLYRVESEDFMGFGKVVVE